MLTAVILGKISTNTETQDNSQQRKTYFCEVGKAGITLERWYQVVSLRLKVREVVFYSDSESILMKGNKDD